VDVSEAELIAAVRELARGKFMERAAANDRSGAFCRENIEELQALRVPAMPCPKEVGGLGVSAFTQTRVVEEAAYGDGSTAVALNMHLFTAEALVGLPPFPRRNQVVEDIAKNGAMICGPVSIPAGEVDNRKSGLRFRDGGGVIIGSGMVGFASASEAAKYIFAAGTLDKGEGQEPDMVLAFPDMDSPGITNLKNWDAMGYRSTASHDLRFEECQIPKGEALVMPLAAVRLITNALAANPAMAASRARGALGICAIWLGLAQAAFDFTIEYVGKRHGLIAGESSVFGAPGFRADEPWAQFGIGAMDHWLGSGRVMLYDMVRRLGEEHATTNEFNREMVRTIYHLRRMSEEVSAGAMRVCGAHAYTRNRSLERIFRDMVGSNVMAWKTDQLQQTLGQGALGMPIAIGGPAPA
jgi:alkylation response protein AidB-like acyl-CoA dehydrogenase